MLNSIQLQVQLIQIQSQYLWFLMLFHYIIMTVLSIQSKTFT
jgi:hypothetical protein